MTIKKWCIRGWQRYQDAILKLYISLYGKGLAEKAMKKARKQKLYGIALSPGIVFLCVIVGNHYLFSICISLILAAGIYFVPDAIIRNRWETTKISFKMDMPNFLDVVCLLLEAGQPLWRAIEIGADLNQSPLCRRIKNALQGTGNLESGQNPALLLEKMMTELQVPIISSVMSAIIQNSRKGEKELASVLRMQGMVCRNERRFTAEQLGNKASTLLLIPSAFVFIAILIMLLTPAVFTAAILTKEG